MTQQQIAEIAGMSDAAYAARLARLVAEEGAAYKAYTDHGFRAPAVVAGSPRAAGHGSWVSGTDAGLQGEWTRLSAMLRETRQTRDAACWRLDRVGPEVAVYVYRPDGAAVEVVHHGTDLSAVGTPWQAVAAVRAAAA